MPRSQPAALPALAAALSLALVPAASVGGTVPVLPMPSAPDDLPLVRVQGFLDQFADTAPSRGPLIGYDYRFDSGFTSGASTFTRFFPLSDIPSGPSGIDATIIDRSPVFGPGPDVPTGTYDIPEGIFPAVPVPPQFQPDLPAAAAAAPGGPLPAGGARVAGQRIDRATTRAIVQSIEGAAGFCSGMDSAYQVDCLADQLSILAENMAPSGEYAPAREAIAEAAAELEALARANASRSIPRRPAVSARNPETRRSSRPIVPVEPAVQEAVAQEAVAIVEELQTELLRSSENSDRRRLPYQQISAALESNKVLLRSA